MKVLEVSNDFLPVNGQFSRCVFFHWDGARHDLFTRLLAKNHLPNVEKYVTSKGSNIMGFSCFPSTTGPTFLPFLAGVLPGPANIPGIRWFDRNNAHSVFDARVSYVGLQGKLFDSHLASNHKTLFELIPESFSINSIVNRGARKFFNQKRLVLSRISNNWFIIDGHAANQLENIVNKDFNFVFANFLSIDKYSHLTGPKSDNTIASYVYLDKIVGKIARILKDRNILDDTLLLVTSDHGHSIIKEHFNLYSYCTKFFDTACFPFPLKRNFDCFATEQGNKAGFLYLRQRSSSWKEIAYHETIENNRRLSYFFKSLLKRKEISLVLTRDEEKNVLLSKKDGVGRIRKKGKEFMYEFDKTDPIGLDIEGCFDLQTSLDITIKKEYNDVLLQATQIFEGNRTGDIVLISNENWDFRVGFIQARKPWNSFEWPLHKSGHGGLSPLQFQVPIAVNYDINREYMRNLGMYQTILQLLGIKNVRAR